MAEVKWIKLSVSIPDNKKIKRIRKMPDGNNIVLFWVFLLARAGESNQKGGLFFTENVPYTDEDLAADFDFTTEFVKFAKLTLEKYKMIELYDDVIFIRNWDEYQQMDKLEKIKEQNRIRQAKYKEKQKMIANKNEEVTLPVTQDNATDIELDIELDIEVDKYLDTEKDKDSIPYKLIIDYLNEKTGKSFKVSTPKYRSLIRARWNEGQRLDDFNKVVDNKVTEWTGTTFPNGKNAENYLQPSTLFGSKFDQYLNASVNNFEQPKEDKKSLVDDYYKEG